MRRDRFIPLVIIFSSVLLLGQTRPVFGNPNNGLEVQIKLANAGDPLDVARVELFKAEMPMPAATPNSRGEVTWVNLSDGSYTVRVTLPGYEPGEQSIELMGGGMRHIFVMLHPDPKAVTTPNVSADDPLVSVRYLAAPEKARNELKEAREARQKGNCKSAIEHGKKAIASAPTLGLAHVEVGMCQMMNNDLDAAQAAFQDAIQQDPKFLYGYIGLSQVHAKREKWNDAAKILGEANQVVPDRAEPFYELAQLQLKTGHLDKAELAAKTALTKNYTRLPDLPFLLARIYVLEGKNDEALKSLQEIEATSVDKDAKERARRSIEALKKPVKPGK